MKTMRLTMTRTFSTHPPTEMAGGSNRGRWASLLARAATCALVLAATLTAAPNEALAQEKQIRVTGPLAGAPAVRKLRLYRERRIEVAPVVSFTLLDQYRRQIFLGLRANFGITDWLAVGAWGGISSSMVGLDLDTHLTRQVQDVNAGRECNDNPTDLDCKLTAVNLGDDFTNQVSSIEWLVAPQATFIPFRGKLGLFNEVFVDADLYVFGGAAFAGLAERPNCDLCTAEATFATESRVAIAPTFGLGFTFFTNRWTSLGAEWRALPFKWNTGGFDVSGEGSGDEADFPDGRITASDREFHFNQMLSLSFGMYFPRQYRVSE